MNEFTKEQYEKLFPDDKSKAAASDKLAEHFYHQNFSTMAKAEPVNGKVQIYINDHRLYSELRHVINDMGSYSETTLTRQQQMLWLKL